MNSGKRKHPLAINTSFAVPDRLWYNVYITTTRSIFLNFVQTTFVKHKADSPFSVALSPCTHVIVPTCVRGERAISTVFVSIQCLTFSGLNNNSSLLVVIDGLFVNGPRASTKPNIYRIYFFAFAFLVAQKRLTSWGSLLSCPLSNTALRLLYKMLFPKGTAALLYFNQHLQQLFLCEKE